MRPTSAPMRNDSSLKEMGWSRSRHITPASGIPSRPRTAYRRMDSPNSGTQEQDWRPRLKIHGAKQSLLRRQRREVEARERDQYINRGVFFGGGRDNVLRNEKRAVKMARDKNTAGWWGRRQTKAKVQLASCYSNSFMPFPKKRVYEGPTSRLRTRGRKGFGSTSYLEFFRPPNSVEVPTPRLGTQSLRDSHKLPQAEKTRAFHSDYNESLRENYKGFTGPVVYGFASTPMNHEVQ